MSASYIGTSDLVFQGDARVSTFPSGLVLVQQSAVCRSTDNKRSSIAVGDQLIVPNTGCITYPYIFPAPTEKRSPVFTTYDISAYGRTSTDFIETFTDYVIQTYSIIVSGDPWTLTMLGNRCTQKGVILASDTTPTTAPGTAPIVTMTRVRGTTKTTTTITSAWVLENAQRTNYGNYDEVIIVWKTGGNQ
jgi:hypothetical protein